ncbi:DUF1534 domain-containing protein [Pseudomonas syringae]|nr:DUF1534 domain-containing protein [Pseudomonas syringae]MCF5494481.1 DUF1534 domain-containing protein [Pseudomonas syringae]MCF5524021.1 DUF1534 domain-containing protein [Pseudomonas syringae]MCF5538028.1 DUF1534 domain-containing protein [Pseudomonas syringae]MCF5559200.1 DUF1534 domain-containing protein [Pseudomonas syringae]
MAQHLSATGGVVPGRQSTPVDDRDPAAGLSQSAPRRTLKSGRIASRTACDAEHRTIVEIIVPHAPAWECRG